MKNILFINKKISINFTLVLPRVSDITLVGELVEGTTLEAQFQVTGGHDGQNTLKWFRGVDNPSDGTIWDEISLCPSRLLFLTSTFYYSSIFRLTFLLSI